MHVLRTLLLGNNPIGRNGGEAMLDACRKCLSLRDLGELSPTVPAVLRQEMMRVLCENEIEARGGDQHCGVLAFGQTSVLREGRRMENGGGGGGDMEEGKNKKGVDDDEEDVEDEDEDVMRSKYPQPCIHTYPWVVETNVPSARKNQLNEQQQKTSGGADGIDWSGWYQHYNVHLYRTSPTTWKEKSGRGDGGDGGDGGGGSGSGSGGSEGETKQSVGSEKEDEYRGLDIEFEGFATCTTDPLHRLALEGGGGGGGGGGGAAAAKAPSVVGASAPRTTSLCYRIVRQTSRNEYPHPGLIVQEDSEDRDAEDGLEYNLRLKKRDVFQAGDRLSVWIKPLLVSPTETSTLYTRNFYLRMPTDAFEKDYDDTVLHDQTFHQLNLWDGDTPFM